MNFSDISMAALKTAEANFPAETTPYEKVNQARQAYQLLVGLNFILEKCEGKTEDPALIAGFLTERIDAALKQAREDGARIVLNAANAVRNTL